MGIANHHREGGPLGMTTRILIVDDDRASTERLEGVLQEQDFETAVASDGVRGLAASRAFGPDLVLLDVMLPQMDGIETCRAIRAESGVPIIILTAKADTDDVVEGLEAGADDYVRKPFRTRELIARIRARL